MYEEFFGLKEKPFSLLPDPSFLFLSQKHATALHLLEYALTGQAGFAVITGEVGSGKTTLLRQFLQLTDRKTTPGVIFQTHSEFGDLLRWALLAFGFTPQSEDRTRTYQEFLDFLVSQRQAGRRTILIVDEAQNLSVSALEELRLLSNVNFDKFLFLQIVLVGQPELLDKLRLPELRQLAQRVTAHYHLEPLSLAETYGYIRHRLKVAGGAETLFDDWAVGAVHVFAGGVPRLVNSLCDMALVYAYADGRKTVDIDIVRAVVEDREASGLSIFARTGTGLSREDLVRLISEGYRAVHAEAEARRAEESAREAAGPAEPGAPAAGGTGTGPAQPGGTAAKRTKRAG